MKATKLLEEARAPVVHLTTRPNDSLKAFILRTVAAQLHAAAGVAAVFGTLVLLRLTKDYGLAHYVSVATFGLSAILLFGASALQHFLDDGFHLSNWLLRTLEDIDKFSVNLLIAGTYTPVLYNTLAGTSLVVMITLVWVLAIFGCLYTAFIDHLPRWARSRFVYTSQFVILGWILVLQIGPIFTRLTGAQIALAVGGGLSYTVGAVAYVLKRPNLHQYFGYHELWHSFVIAGCLLFYLLVGSFYIS